MQTAKLRHKQQPLLGESPSHSLVWSCAQIPSIPQHLSTFAVAETGGCYQQHPEIKSAPARVQLDQVCSISCPC